MSVMRINKTKNYTVMSNYHLRDKNLSLKAKGLLSMMLSLPDNWSYSIAGLVSICKESETAVRSALNELKKYQYVIVSKKYPNETKSKKIEYVYDVFECPQQKNQDSENLCLDNQGVGFDRQLNTNKQNTDKQNKDININAFFQEKKEHFKTDGDLYDFIKDKINELSQNIHFDNENDKSCLIEIIYYFYNKYYEVEGIEHPILSDNAYKNIIRQYLCPTPYMYEQSISGYNDYRQMIDRYFEINFGKNKKNGYGGQKVIDRLISHFMSENIRNNIAMQIFR